MKLSAVFAAVPSGVGGNMLACAPAMTASPAQIRNVVNLTAGRIGFTSSAAEKSISRVAVPRTGARPAGHRQGADHAKPDGDPSEQGGWAVVNLASLGEVGFVEHAELARCLPANGRRGG